MMAHIAGNVSIKEPVKNGVFCSLVNPWLRTETTNLLMMPSKNQTTSLKGV